MASQTLGTNNGGFPPIIRFEAILAITAQATSRQTKSSCIKFMHLGHSSIRNRLTHGCSGTVALDIIVLFAELVRELELR